MNNTLLLSIIVPVYNVEQYLERCIDSILNQTFSNFELILIDDGSKDNSSKICDRYASIDSRIVVMHKENGGISSARNAGLDIAKGDYIGFVDSDDYIDKNYYEDLMNVACENSIDLCVSNNVYHYRHNNYKYRILSLNSTEKCNKVLTDIDKIKKGKYNYYAVWSCTYKKELIDKNSIRFDERLKQGHEDVFFNMDYNQVCKRIYIKNMYGYRWMYNKNSISRGISSYDGLIEKCRLYREKLVSLNYDHVDEKITYTFWDGYMHCVNSIVKNSEIDFIEKKNLIANISKNNKTTQYFSELTKTDILDNKLYKTLYILILKQKYSLIIVLLTIYNKLVH